MKIKSNLPTIFASLIRRDRRDEDANVCPNRWPKIGTWRRSHERSQIDWVADGLGLSEDRMRYSDEEVKRVTYNQDLVEAIRDFEMQANAEYFKERNMLKEDKVSSVEFCNFAKSFDYRTAKSYRELLPFLSLESIKKHYDFLIAKGLERPVRARLECLMGVRVSPSDALSPRPVLSQFANNKIARSEV